MTNVGKEDQSMSQDDLKKEQKENSSVAEETPMTSPVKQLLNKSNTDEAINL